MERLLTISRRVMFGLVIALICAAAVYLAGWSSLVSMFTTDHETFSPSMDAWQFFSQQAYQHWLATIPPESKLLVDKPSDTQEAIEWARTLMAKNPADPVLVANYVRQCLYASDELRPREEIIDACRHGSQIDPDNAYFHLISAHIQLQAAATPANTGDGPPDPAAVFQWDAPWFTAPEKMHQTFTLNRCQITDQAGLRAGLDEFHRAAQCSAVSNYAREMLQRQLACVPPPTRLSDLLMRIDMEASSRDHDFLCYSDASEIACSAALDAALQSRANEADAIISDVRRIARSAMAAANGTTKILLALRIHTNVIAADVLVGRQLGQAARFSAAQMRFVDFARQDEQVRRRARGARELYFAIDGRSFLPFDKPPELTAEYAVFDRTMLAFLAFSLLPVAGGMWLMGLFRRRPAAFMGWPRLMRATLTALSPIAADGLVTTIGGFGGRHQTFRASLDQIMIEYAAVSLAVFWVISRFNDGAPNNGAPETESTKLPRFARRRRAVINVLLGLLVLAYLICRHFGLGDDNLDLWQCSLLFIPLCLFFDLNNFANPLWQYLIIEALLAECSALLQLTVGLDGGNPLTINLTVVGGAITALALVFLVRTVRHQRGRSLIYVLLAWAIAIVAAVGVVAGYAPAYGPPMPRPEEWYLIATAAFAGGAIAISLVRAIRDLRAAAPSGFDRYACRAPLLISTLLAMLLIFAPLLRWQERNAVTQANKSSGFSGQFESQDSPWRQMQQAVASEPE